MQLKVEGKKLYVSIVKDLALSIKDIGELLSLSDCIEERRLIVWDITFFDNSNQRMEFDKIRFGNN
jgi:hypothetical protein